MRALAPPGRFGLADRRIVTLMTMTGIVQGFAGSLLTATLPFARRGLGLSQGEMSLVLAVTRIGSLAALAFSVWGDRRGRRRPFLLALAVLSAASGATAWAPEVATFAIFQSAVRASSVALAALGAVYLAEVLAPAIRAYGMAFYAVAGSLGGGAALLLLPVADRGPGSWRILYGLGIAGFAFLPILVRTLRESPVFRRPSRTIGLSAVMRPPHTGTFLKLALVSLLIGAYSSPAITFTLERLITELDWSAATARFLVIGGGAVGALGLFVGGRMADVVGRRPTTFLAVTTGLLGGLGFYWLESGWLLAPSVALASFGSSAFIPAHTAHRSELFPTSIRATAGAWLSNAGIVGSLISFSAGFVIIDRLGLSITITIFGIGVLVSGWLVLTLPETKGIKLVPDEPPATSNERPGSAP